MTSSQSPTRKNKCHVWDLPFLKVDWQCRIIRHHRIHVECLKENTVPAKSIQFPVILCCRFVNPPCWQIAKDHGNYSPTAVYVFTDNRGRTLYNCRARALGEQAGCIFFSYTKSATLVMLFNWDFFLQIDSKKESFKNIRKFVDGCNFDVQKKIASGIDRWMTTHKSRF